MDRTVSSQRRTEYEEAERRHGETVGELERVTRRVEAARLATFVIGAVVALLRNDLSIPPAIAFPFVGVALVAFLFLVVRHRRLRAMLGRARAARAFARLGIARLARDWSEIALILEGLGAVDPLLEERPPAEERHPYLEDLDVFGPASVRALLGPTPTPTGSETLERWLRAPAAPDEIGRRQSAVRGLAPDAEARAGLATESLLLDPVGRRSWARFHDWLESPPIFSSIPPWARLVAFGMPPVTLVMFGIWVMSVGWPAWTWFVPLAIQTALAWRWGKVLHDWFEASSAKSPGIRRHHALFAAWETYASNEDVVRDLQAGLRSDTGDYASVEIRRLERWLDAVDSRASMFHIVFASIFLWDIHVAMGLERWRARAGAAVPGWFEALGELEALSALATLAYDHPDWCFPTLRDGAPGFEADALGHPLLGDDVRRTSDVALDPPGRFLLVTGSNMSGKSTLMRSIGLAAVLGQAGSVVCATRAELTPLRTFTSMRIKDSLTDGISHFMAELLRLKALVDAVPEDRDGPALLYLIDEVLQGTNSEERRVAARRIVRHLLASHAIGAVTTHDLALHDDPHLDPASSKVHFRETVDEEGDRVLTFDYVLRPGLATSRNALKLLRIVGLEEKGVLDGEGAASRIP